PVSAFCRLISFPLESRWLRAMTKSVSPASTTPKEAPEERAYPWVHNLHPPPSNARLPEQSPARDKAKQVQQFAEICSSVSNLLVVTSRLYKKDAADCSTRGRPSERQVSAH